MGLENKKILVTGGAGFIGSNFVRLLYANYNHISVRVLDKLTYSGNLANLEAFRSLKGFDFIQGDICDEAVVARAMEGIDIVVNFAAEVAVDRSIDHSQSFLKTDIFGVFVLLNEVKKRGTLEKFIQISLIKWRVFPSIF